MLSYKMSNDLVKLLVWTHKRSFSNPCKCSCYRACKYSRLGIVPAERALDECNNRDLEKYKASYPQLRRRLFSTRASGLKGLYRVYCRILENQKPQINGTERESIMHATRALNV